MRMRLAMAIALTSLIPATASFGQPAALEPKSAAGTPADAEAVPPLRFLSDAEADASRLVPPPAQPGSPELARALDEVRSVVAAASPERKVRAAADEAEVVTRFNEAAGRDLSTLPATSALLNTIADETEAVITRAKLFFKLPRPYQIDPALPHCGKGGNAAKAYPSGHAGFGYSVGWTLSRLIPERAPQILLRAQDYAFSREVCGVHFRADTEASRVIGTLIADRLLADPRLAAQVAAARAELARR